MSCVRSAKTPASAANGQAIAGPEVNDPVREGDLELPVEQVSDMRLRAPVPLDEGAGEFYQSNPLSAPFDHLVSRTGRQDLPLD